MKQRALSEQGFTLIELMVVLVVIGIASAAIGISIRPDPLKNLRADASHLALALQLAQVEAQTTGRPIRASFDGKGYVLSRRTLDGNAEETFDNDPPLRPQRWQSDNVRVRIDPRQALVLNGEWIVQPLRLTLSDGQNSLSLVRSANGRIQVQ
jgi:general secretion pathway protein H